MSKGIIFEAPIRIAGREVILLRDEIAGESSAADALLVLNASGRHESVWVAESVLLEVRERHPNIPVYGFWQTVIASRKLPAEGMPISTVRLGPSDGFFLSQEEGKAVMSGGYVGSVLTMPFNIPVSKTYELALELQDLEVPDEPILSIAESSRIRHAADRRRYALTALACAAVAGLGIIYDLRAAANSAANKASVETLQAQAADLTDQVARLRGSRNPLGKMDATKLEITLTRLGEVVRRSGSLDLNPVALNGAPVTFDTDRILPPYTFPIVASGKSSGLVGVQFSPDGSADAQVLSMGRATAP